jgi:hypothetical protein
MTANLSRLTLAAAAFALAACQPQQTPEQAAAAQLEAQLKAALNDPTAAIPNINEQQLSAAIAQGAQMAQALDPDMSPEDRAKLNAVAGAIASGQSDPNASAWLSGADRALGVLATVKDAATANAAKAQLAPIYAQMAGPAAALKAMNSDQRDVAFGSALPQYMSFGLKASNIMMAHSQSPEVQALISDLLDDMPQP